MYSKCISFPSSKSNSCIVSLAFSGHAKSFLYPVTTKSLKFVSIYLCGRGGNMLQAAQNAAHFLLNATNNMGDIYHFCLSQ